MEQIPAESAQQTKPAPVAWKVETIAEGLQIPWSIALSKDGKIFFTERVGRLSVIDKTGNRPRILGEIPVAKSSDPGFATGLLGLALDPNYPKEPYLYAYYTYSVGQGLFNRLVRFREIKNKVVEDQILLDKIPGSTWQNGGAIKFGPDGKLYVPTGGGKGSPSAEPSTKILTVLTGSDHPDHEAQDIRSPVGKILRINRDGTFPRDNPFSGSPVYSYGHRHSQGLAWHPVTGKLYSTEHGPVGGWDEINLIEAGKNYGWPRFKGHTGNIRFSMAFFKPQYTKAVVVYTPAIAPSGGSFYSGKVIPQWKNSLFVATLRGEHLRRIELTPDGMSIKFEERLLENTYGRLRAVTEGPDGFLYFSTSNGDDRILRIVPRKVK